MDHQNTRKHLAETTLEQLGRAWEEGYRAEDIRLDLDKIRLLRLVNHHVGDLDLSQCPTFARLYEAVMLRPIQEPIIDDRDYP